MQKTRPTAPVHDSELNQVFFEADDGHLKDFYLIPALDNNTKQDCQCKHFGPHLIMEIA